MEFLDARRLTGPNLLMDGPGSILDIACSPERAGLLYPVWSAHVERMFAALDWPQTERYSVLLDGGISLAFAAPIDALYAASELNEWAYAACAAELDAEPEPDFAMTVAALQSAIREEANPALLALQSAAREHGVPMLWDDDEVSLGLGDCAQTWPVRDLPDPESVDWTRYHSIPIGLVTGTNGKTTTVRMAFSILRAAGGGVGLSSTDWIAVNDRIMDKDDWSGPGGARAVLRQKGVNTAILETARGGLLRRGLGVDVADAALLTNISEDHIGDFGSRNLDELLDIKWIAARAVEDGGRLVLNADDDLLVARSQQHNGEIVWFSLDAGNRLLREHVAAGGTAFAAEAGDLVRLQGDRRELICHATDIPIAMQGKALHNVANALAACALTERLGANLEAMRVGLSRMTQDDNPGRCNVYNVAGCTVLVDFAHNPGAMKALFLMARALPGKRRVLCFGHAGDRPDALLEEISRAAWEIGLDRVVVSELVRHHRGREHGEIYRVIRNELLRCGAAPEQLEHNEEETESFRSALAWAEPGDLVIMIALAERAEIAAILDELGAVRMTFQS
jgi:UDP-N-acetylmuramyl tripeptide synthase